MRGPISTRSVPGNRNSAGIGYVVIPKDIERNIYIESCFRTNSISFAPENGGRFDSIPVSKTVFKDLVFPETSDKIGSCVVWVNIPKFNQPIIVGIISKNREFQNIKENQFSFNKQTKNGYVEITGDPDTSTIFINIDSYKDSSGALNIKINNTNNTAKLNLLVKGDIDIESSNNINIRAAETISVKVVNLQDTNNDKVTEVIYTRGIGFKYLDEFSNEISVNDDGFTIKTPEEDLTALITDLFTEIKNIIVTTPAGAGTISPTTISKLETLENRFKKLLK